MEEAPPLPVVGVNKLTAFTVGIKRVPSFEGVCPGCQCEGEHAAMCPEWITRTAASVSTDDARNSLEYSSAFWCGVEMPTVSFWRAVIETQRKD